MHHDAVFWYVWKNLVLFVVAVVVFLPPLPLFFWQMFGDLMFFFSGYQVKGAYILVCLFAARQMSGLLKDAMVFLGGCGFQHSCHILALFFQLLSRSGHVNKSAGRF
jgi:hypothetical protein